MPAPWSASLSPPSPLPTVLAVGEAGPGPSPPHPLRPLFLPRAPSL